MRFGLLKSVTIQETSRGAFLVSKKPLAVVQVNRPLLTLLSGGADGAIVPETRREVRILENLVAGGFAERREDSSLTAGRRPSVSVVIPVRDRQEELRRCLDSLARLHYPKEKLEVIVVDDGSRDRSPEVARTSGARLVRSGGIGKGPASARNRGAAVAGGEILAFIDSDCVASSFWLAELVEAFEDPEMAAVGGKVDGMYSTGSLDRYDAVMSSLTLGLRERRGQHGKDTFYLPSCNLLVRHEAFRKVGGFRPDLQVGEDVDLSWRLRDSGGKIAYLPKGRVHHEHRNRLIAFLRRRFEYGTSEGLLQVLHPMRRKTVAFPAVSTGILVLFILGALGGGGYCIVLAGALLIADGALVRSQLARRGLPVGLFSVLAARLRALGGQVYYLGYHLIRYYGIPLLCAGLAWPRLGLILLLLFTGVGSTDYCVRKPNLSLPAFFGFYLMEQIAYGAGVFRGCLGHRNFGSYRLAVPHRLQNAS